MLYWANMLTHVLTFLHYLGQFFFLFLTQSWLWDMLRAGWITANSEGRTVFKKCISELVWIQVMFSCG